ncbi:MAG: hypothetical protein DWH91_03630 [Planctomycetota bacterium]|nr:MAG: hypothetical protein DWH91_03630 [Planctomycetota bacterium]
MSFSFFQTARGRKVTVPKLSR